MDTKHTEPTRIARRKRARRRALDPARLPISISVEEIVADLTYRGGSR